MTKSHKGQIQSPQAHGDSGYSKNLLWFKGLCPKLPINEIEYNYINLLMH